MLIARATDDSGREQPLKRDPARAIARFARQHQITQIVIGSSKRTRWRHLAGGGSHVTRVIREAGAFGIDVHVIARRDLPPAEAAAGSAANSDLIEASQRRLKE